ncbi:MAG: NAD(P)H-dependent oxidoreductase [Candidatus Caldatribacteriota bacterium]|nr:NAD(P)H-dependent oxidoreductase [Candidatus Caldatribacteriota bacterium]
MKNLYLIQTGKITKKFKEIIDYSTKDYAPELITSSRELPDLRGKKIIIAIELDQCGFNVPLFDILLKLKKRGDKSLLNSKAVIIVQSSSELFTKSIARKIILLCNQMGCAFPGHPVVEAIENLNNFLTWQKIYNTPLFEIYKKKCKDLVNRLIKEKLVQIDHPKILILHSSLFKTSNTLMLWRMVKKNLTGEEIRELHVENGTVVDCRGCSYKTCIHYSEEKSCFYGGIMVKEILPAIEGADSIIWLCPNYNDAISAKLMAVINRMTVLYKRVDFRNKTIFSIIVSGNSGTDCIAKQLIGALNINKGFRLPPYFYLTAVANDPGAVRKIPGIKIKAKVFSNRIKKDIKKYDEEDE